LTISTRSIMTGADKTFDDAEPADYFCWCQATKEIGAGMFVCAYKQRE
jgi:hypothetical protein